jgi:hypothetical protein
MALFVDFSAFRLNIKTLADAAEKNEQHLLSNIKIYVKTALFKLIISESETVK